ncbi:odv-e66 [Agrotis segetum nucleopolyhedrovirus B]|uniref:Odv-e66 n=1 Tax=Agrotis segetum nucleopolyhedrovirus B TaxID=1580580 RepID=A0A0A7KR77_9ABAC|nr:odv-e66 [Agrotis segetum nucleopolyhedrovirus B]AIZ48618.1 odv-e66 [Agrotis segetum nucleopolyhedrovirus B]
MWLYIFMVAAFVAFVLILIWQTNILVVDLETKPQYIVWLNGQQYDYEQDDQRVYESYDEQAVNYCDLFEKHYLDTLHLKFLQKAEKVLNPTRQFSNDENIFVGLTPWSSAAHFGTLLHTLIGYGVRFRDADDVLYLDEELAYRLYDAMFAIYERLPIPAPTHQAPWGDRTDWYHFSITMPECFQHTCIVLRGFYDDLVDLTESLLYYYLPLPTLSMGWRRTAGNAMRMCLPYAYGQLLRGYSFTDIASEIEVQYVLDLIRFPLVAIGNGIHYDYPYFDHTDVRAYGYLVNSYFTFSYYNFLFGEDTVNLENVHRSLALISSNRGLVHPALLSRTGSSHSAVLAHIMDYPNGVVSADFGKILTVRNAFYFGSVVGQAPDIAYYEADPNNSLHAPLWTMTRKIWANAGRIATQRSLGLESGILLTTNLNGVVNVPTTGPSTSSFHPSVAYTAICATANAGVMVMHVRFEELNLEFHSYTLYHRHGMFQLYFKIKSLRTISNNARCVVLTRDTTFEPKWMAPSNLIYANGVAAKHHNIVNNNSLSNFDVRSFDELNLQTAEQIISADLVNAGAGVTCFSLLAGEVAHRDNTTCERITGTDAFVVSTNSNSIRCVVDFPVVVLRDDETREITINDATSVSRRMHNLTFAKISPTLSLLSMTVDNLYVPANVKRVDDRFLLENAHGNQFRFTF